MRIRGFELGFLDLKSYALSIAPQSQDESRSSQNVDRLLQRRDWLFKQCNWSRDINKAKHWLTQQGQTWESPLDRGNSQISLCV